MHRFLAKTLETAGRKMREAVELKEDGHVQTLREASEKVTQRTLLDVQRKLAQIRQLPPEQRTAELSKLTQEWGVKELMERLTRPRK